MNKAEVSVSGRLYGLDRHGWRSDFGELTVNANAAGTSMFTLPDFADTWDRLYLEVIGSGIRLCADTAIVHTKPSGRVWPYAAAAISTLAFAGSLAAGYFVERPTVTALSAVSPAAPGTVQVSFATGGGISKGTFDAVAADGTILNSGALPSTSGQLPIFVPVKIAGQRVRVRIALANPLGHAERETSFDVAAAVQAPVRHAVQPIATPAGPRIAYFTAHREQVDGKTSVLASYQASGERGTVRVRNESGAVLGSRPFSHVGTTRIPLADDAAGRPLRTEIEVERAGVRSTAAIQIPGVGAPSDAASPAAIAASDDVGSNPLPSDPFYVVQRVIAGKTFSVEIRHPLPDLRIGLQTTDGTTIDEVDVPAGARTIVLRAPASSMLEIYYLAATFTRSSAEETLVRSLRIYPD